MHNGHTHSDLKLPVATSLAMVYSPVQVWRDIYDLECALERGTLFAELDKPLLSAGR
ncbi:MAG: spore coat associated protein CotJA [Clostridia bacterium]|nr:spore coat associated protein CotJA [Clostridia bacterium]MBQ5601432.1 spore coat associated protein CotJA [Clostridia bacterium]